MQTLSKHPKIFFYIKLMRLNQPTGIWLLLWPCWWSIASACKVFPDLSLLIIFAVGSVIMRAAGCVINDIIDQDFDARVERTKSRPLANKELTQHQALITLAILLLLAFLILITFNHLTIILGIISLIPIVIYPYMKRITYWPQAFLGITFNIGALMGYSAVTNQLPYAAITLYFAGICWTLGYDTIYAHQDKADDELIGIKSTALRLGKDTKRWLIIFYGLSLVFLILTGMLANMKIGYYLGFFGVLAHFYWQISKLDISNGADCMSKFKANIWLGAIVFVSIIIGKI